MCMCSAYDGKVHGVGRRIGKDGHPECPNVVPSDPEEPIDYTVLVFCDRDCDCHPNNDSDGEWIDPAAMYE